MIDRVLGCHGNLQRLNVTVMSVLPKTAGSSYYRVPTILIAAIMQVTWRFFIGEDMRWRWQQLSTDRSVVAESPGS
ncbi:MAG: hypothetical protein ACXWC3_24665, partial [Burkholderiales bacterium]